MPLADDLSPRGLSTFENWVAKIPGSRYYLREGKVYLSHGIIRSADPETFRWWPGDFACDAKCCYVHGRLFKDADPAAFRPLNFAFATDGQQVWGPLGVVKTCNASRFSVLDDGYIRSVDGGRIADGYGTDGTSIFYSGGHTTPKPLKSADTANFRSINHSGFGVDAKRVVRGTVTLTGADPATWRWIAGAYSRDAHRVWFGVREVKGADLATFEVLPRPGEYYAKDAERYYRDDLAISRETFEEGVAGSHPRNWKRWEQGNAGVFDR